MADESTDNTNDVTPPKIKLNGNGHAAHPEQAPGQAAPTPPKFQSAQRQPKEQTARIDFAAAVAPSTVRLTSATPPPVAKKATSKIDLGGGMKEMSQQELDELAKRSTIRITSPVEMKPMTQEDKEAAAKKSTVRIDETVSMQPMSDEQKEEAIKKSTVRIDTVTDMKPMSQEDMEESAKKTTARVLIDEDRLKGDTTRIEPARDAEPSEAAKKRTARIDLGEVLDEEDDIFKRRTALLDASKLVGATEAPGAPRTIRIKRPGTPPTAQIAPVAPQEEEVVAPISQAEAARKSETARIDLPPEVSDQPPTRRKTIRIKRPGSTTGSKPLMITRTPAEASAEEGAAPVRAQDEEDSPLFAWFAVAAVLVAVVLIYVLASQVGTVAELVPARFPYAGSL